MLEDVQDGKCLALMGFYLSFLPSLLAGLVAGRRMI